MVGNRLEVCLHLSTCSGSALQSVVTCANKAGLEVTDTVFEGIAAAEAVLSADERELGVCLADIGASSTELVVFFEGTWRIRRCCRLAATTLRMILRWGCM